jgi:hypothetical protein
MSVLIAALVWPECEDVYSGNGGVGRNVVQPGSM